MANRMASFPCRFHSHAATTSGLRTRLKKKRLVRDGQTLHVRSLGQMGYHQDQQLARQGLVQRGQSNDVRTKAHRGGTESNVPKSSRASEVQGFGFHPM